MQEEGGGASSRQTASEWISLQFCQTSCHPFPPLGDDSPLKPYFFFLIENIPRRERERKRAQEDDEGRRITIYAAPLMNRPPNFGEICNRRVKKKHVNKIGWLTFSLHPSVAWLVTSTVSLRISNESCGPAH